MTSDRSGNPDLWRLSVDGGELQHVVADPAPDWGGTWSPDGRHIAFFSYRSGNRDLWRVAVNGGPAEQLTDDSGSDWLPTWSPDGRWLAARSVVGGKLWRISPTGADLEVRFVDQVGAIHWLWVADVVQAPPHSR